MACQNRIKWKPKGTDILGLAIMPAAEPMLQIATKKLHIMLFNVQFLAFSAIIETVLSYLPISLQLHSLF